MKAAPIPHFVRDLPARPVQARRRSRDGVRLVTGEEAERQGLGAARGVVIGLAASVALFWLPLILLLVNLRR
jgi:hypothetical protein